MADDDRDFYSRDRPDDPGLEEDRPRGGGPDEPGQHGNGIIWGVVIAVIVVLFVVLLFII